jgi:DNA-binding response OmpR family regulator
VTSSPVPPAAEPSPTAKPRILIADDEPGTLALLAEMLAYSGYDVVQARDGLEALLRVRETRPALILLDVMMPGLDGREVTRRLRADHANDGMPIILHSVADEAEIDWRGAGASGFLQKPFPIRELPAIIRRHLQGHVASK